MKPKVGYRDAVDYDAASDSLDNAEEGESQGGLAGTCPSYYPNLRERIGFQELGYSIWWRVVQFLMYPDTIFHSETRNGLTRWGPLSSGPTAVM